MSTSTSTAYTILPSPPQSWRSTTLLQNLHSTSNLPIPIPGPGQVLVNIRAAALNARDLMVVAHDPIYPIETIEGLSPCSDGAGIVAKVGDGGKAEWEIGDRVVLCPNLGWKDKEWPVLTELKGGGGGDVMGTLREWVVVESDQLLPAPAHLSFTQLASIPTAGGTAHNALFFGPLPLTPSMTILTQGTGGVSVFAIQLASALGATVISTSSSTSKLALAKEFGATHLINYTETPDWASKALELTGGKGVDHVIDVGGSGTISQSLKAVRQGGLVSVIGNLTGNVKKEEEGLGDLVAQILFGAKSVRGVFGGNKRVWESLLKFVEEKKVVPYLGKEFGWTEAKQAFELLGRREAVGKIAIRVGEDERRG